MPYCISIAGWWLAPSPRQNRPPVAWLIVRDWAASVPAKVVCIATTDVPSPMSGTSRPTIANVTIGSAFATWGFQ